MSTRRITIAAVVTVVICCVGVFLVWRATRSTLDYEQLVALLARGDSSLSEAEVDQLLGFFGSEKRCAELDAEQQQNVISVVIDYHARTGDVYVPAMLALRWKQGKVFQGLPQMVADEVNNERPGSSGLLGIVCDVDPAPMAHIDVDRTMRASVDYTLIFTVLHILHKHQQINNYDAQIDALLLRGDLPPKYREAYTKLAGRD